MSAKERKQFDKVAVAVVFDFAALIDAAKRQEQLLAILRPLRFPGVTQPGYPGLFMDRL